MLSSVFFLPICYALRRSSWKFFMPHITWKLLIHPRKSTGIQALVNKLSFAIYQPSAGLHDRCLQNKMAWPVSLGGIWYYAINRFMKALQCLIVSLDTQIYICVLFHIDWETHVSSMFRLKWHSLQTAIVISQVFTILIALLGLFTIALIEVLSWFFFSQR